MKTSYRFMNTPSGAGFMGLQVVSYGAWSMHIECIAVGGTLKEVREKVEAEIGRNLTEADIELKTSNYKFDQLF